MASLSNSGDPMAVFVSQDPQKYRQLCDRNSIPPEVCPGCGGVRDVHPFSCEVAIRQRAIEALSGGIHGFFFAENVKVPDGQDPLIWAFSGGRDILSSIPNDGGEYWLALSARLSEFFDDPWNPSAVFARRVAEALADLSLKGENRGW